MSGSNSLFEKAMYRISTMFGRKSIEQMAEEKRKAAEQKVMEEQRAAMELEKNERESAEKIKRDFVESVISDLENNTNTKIQQTTTNGRWPNQTLTFTVIVGGKLETKIIVENDQSYYSCKGSVENFFSWSECRTIYPGPFNFKGEGLSKELSSSLDDALKKYAEPTVVDALNSRKAKGVPEFALDYKSYHISQYTSCYEVISSLRIINDSGEFKIKFNDSEIPFDEKTFEFNKWDLKRALKETSISVLEDHHMRIIDGAIKIKAFREHGLSSPATEQKLYEKIKEYNERTGAGISLLTQCDLYTLTCKSTDRRHYKPLEYCRSATLGQAFGTMCRMVDSLELDKEASEFCREISHKAPRGARLIHELVPADKESPWIYCLSIRSIIDVDDDSEEKGEITIARGRIDDLTQKMKYYSLNPNLIFNKINDEGYRKFEKTKIAAPAISNKERINHPKFN